MQYSYVAFLFNTKNNLLFCGNHRDLQNISSVCNVMYVGSDDRNLNEDKKEQKTFGFGSVISNIDLNTRFLDLYIYELLKFLPL